jgi:hypothetical protein
VDDWNYLVPEKPRKRVKSLIKFLPGQIV